MTSQMHHGRAASPTIAGLFALLLIQVTHAAPLIIDDFAYTNNTAARAAWASASAPAVTMSSSGEWGTEQVMVLGCDFATRPTRCFWDRAVSLNLSTYTEFELEVYVSNPAPISYFTLYFRSGAGWYNGTAYVTKTGWQTLRFVASDFSIEGTPAGWAKIDGIRLSPWKALSQNTYLAARELRATTPTVLLVRDTETDNPEVVQQTIDRHLSWLGGYNVRCGVVTRAGVEAGLLQGSRVAILPYNKSVSEAEMGQYESYVAAGGKLIVYYLMPSRIPTLLGFRNVRWTQGNYAAWLFSDPKITNLPPRVRQASWNITIAEPNGSYNSRVSAVWENAAGQNTGQAAWLASDRGFFMSHILLGDDADQKSFALLCLLGSIVPDVWPAACAGAIADIGVVGPYEDYRQASADIARLGALTLRDTFVQKELTMADDNLLAALQHEANSRFSEAIYAAHAAREHLREAYIRCQKPVTPEFRAIWEHHSTGPFPGNWAAGIAALATNGFNAVFPNMLWGGLAHYNSAYLPHSSEYNTYGDQIAACVAAAHARGVQVHVWKVNWNLATAPQSFIDSMRLAGRTQVSKTGTATDWLCPSHPDNFALETNSMLEVVRNYDVDGIHFDYIRYPDGDHCYCSGCAARFQSQTGRTVTNWPADVLVSGSLRTAFLDWRRAQITRLVDAVYKQTKALKPGVKVSAAVFGYAASAYDGVGQDWRLWVTNGILDFVCPMDYTASFPSFTNLIGQQLRSVAGQMPVYPGIGAYIMETDGTLAQLHATRTADTGGFIIFELSPTSAATLLPALGSGATAPDEPDTDEDLLPDSWEANWFGSLMAAGQGTDKDGDSLTDRQEYILGTDPTNASHALVLKVEGQGAQVRLTFDARGVEAAGYRNAARHYRIETAALPGPNALWNGVPGFQDYTAQPGAIPVSAVLSPEPEAVKFYRLKVWLQEAR